MTCVILPHHRCDEIPHRPQRETAGCYRKSPTLGLGIGLTVSRSVQYFIGAPWRARVTCELRNCEWVFCELKCEPARDWSAIFRITRSLPGANAIAQQEFSYRKLRHAWLSCDLGTCKSRELSHAGLSNRTVLVMDSTWYSGRAWCETLHQWAETFAVTWLHCALAVAQCIVIGPAGLQRAGKREVFVGGCVGLLPQ